jgi:hypothetical protein
LTSDEFGVGVFWNVDNDALWKDIGSLSSRFVVRRGFCRFVLADVYNNEYCFGGF